MVSTIVPAFEDLKCLEFDCPTIMRFSETGFPYLIIILLPNHKIIKFQLRQHVRKNSLSMSFLRIWTISVPMKKRQWMNRLLSHIKFSHDKNESKIH